MHDCCSMRFLITNFNNKHYIVIVYIVIVYIQHVLSEAITFTITNTTNLIYNMKLTSLVAGITVYNW